MPLFFHDETDLYDARGRKFDSATISFAPETRQPGPSWQKLSACEAVAWLQKTPNRVRPPVAVIGPREASAGERETAYLLGRDLAAAGLTVLCGGRQGVMEEVCRGVHEAGGLSIGLLPEGDWSAGNRYSTVPIATGIGIARNALIARAAHVMVAVGAGLGTISEMALGLQFGKRVFAIAEKRLIEGVELFPTWDALAEPFHTAVLNWRE